MGHKTTIKARLKQWVMKHWDEMLFYSFLLVCFTFTVTKIKDYGASWDEPIFYQFAALHPRVYLAGAQGIMLEEYLQFADLPYYGSAYVILGQLFANGLARLGMYDIFDAWHVVNFGTFTVGTIFLYRLCRAFTGKFPAMAAAVLYFSQPLLFGHGVINPKDTPFTTFFMLSVLLGLRMIHYQSGKRSASNHARKGRRDWLKQRSSQILLGLTVLTAADRIGNHFLIFPAARMLGWDIPTPQATLGSTVVLIVLVLAQMATYLQQASKAQRSVFWAGAVLGLTSSIRILGPAAGGLVLVMWALKEKPKNMILPAAGYAATALAVSYATWPYLWKAPIVNFIETVQVMTAFPWQGAVLFNGTYYAPNSIHWYYLIAMMGIQLTIPTLVLAGMGTFRCVKMLFQSRFSKAMLMLPLLWLYVPLAAWVLMRPAIYDNFRQYLFILPPAFILAAIGLTGVCERVHKRHWKALAGLGAVLPGVIGVLYLHPYPYVYYNGMVGWTTNVNRRFEADYWGTSLCAAAEYLDPLITDESRVFLVTEIMEQQFRRCTDKAPKYVFNPEGEPPPDYAVILNRWDAGEYMYPDWETVYAISVGETPLTIIRKRP